MRKIEVIHYEPYSESECGNVWTPARIELKVDGVKRTVTPYFEGYFGLDGKEYHYSDRTGTIKEIH